MFVYKVLFVLNFESLLRRGFLRYFLLGRREVILSEHITESRESSSSFAILTIRFRSLFFIFLGKCHLKRGIDHDLLVCIFIELKFILIAFGIFSEQFILLSNDLFAGSLLKVQNMVGVDR